MDRRVANVTVSIEKHGDFVGVVEGEVSAAQITGRTSARTLPEDVIKSLLERAEKILRQQLKENV